MKRSAVRWLLFGAAFWLALGAVSAESAEESTDSSLPEALTEDDFHRHGLGATRVELGQKLFYDRVLSGSYRVSCATCHNHDRASSNGFMLPGRKAATRDDLAVNGLPVYEPFEPSSRHAPALFNLGAKQFRTMFFDGRVAVNESGELTAPEGARLPPGLADVVAAQALFPAIDAEELTGRVDSDLAKAAHSGNEAVWTALVARLRDLEGYPPLFAGAYDDVSDAADIRIDHVANAISSFLRHEWRADDSAFDRYLRGNRAALTSRQLQGMKLFYGEAGCSTCHQGALQTDHDFHALAMPPWRFDAAGDDLHEPHPGRIRVTARDEDRYRMRTPSLRNVTATGPWGHAGAFDALEAAIRHHVDPRESLEVWAAARDLNNAQRAVIGDIAKTARPVSPDLSENDLAALIAFLQSLTDEKSLVGRLGKPDEVPSFLALD